MSKFSEEQFNKARCPYCNSQDWISKGFRHGTPTEANNVYTCNTCEESWNILYKQIKVVALDGSRREFTGLGK